MRTFLPLLFVGCTSSLSSFTATETESPAPTEGDESEELLDTADGVGAAERDDSALLLDTAPTLLDCADDLFPGLGTTQGGTDDFRGSCGGDGGVDTTMSFVAPEAGTWRFELSETYFDTVLYVVDGCSNRELTCADTEEPEVVGAVLDAGQEVIVVVDAAGGGQGIYTIEASLAPDSEGACGNGVDDDLDGDVDCMDSDCFDKPRCEEDCSNGVDDDGDGLADCMDPTCAGEPECVADCADVELLDPLPITALGSTTGGSNDWDPSCQSTSNAPDRSFSFVAPATGTYTFDTDGSSFDTVLTLLDACGGQELGCDDDGAAGTQSMLTVSLQAGEQVVIVVDGYSNWEGDVQLNVR